jgi:hypothetical protein
MTPYGGEEWKPRESLGLGLWPVQRQRNSDLRLRDGSPSIRVKRVSEARYAPASRSRTDNCTGQMADPIGADARASLVGSLAR